MDKLTIEISPQTKHNLLIFLERIQLNGKEVPAYNEIMQAINTSKETQSENEE